MPSNAGTAKESGGFMQFRRVARFSWATYSVIRLIWDDLMAELNAEPESSLSEKRPAGTSASSVEFPFLKNTFQIFLGLVAFCLLMSFLMPGIVSRETSPQAICKNNLSNSGKALHK